jgi:hypothetical protein
MSLWADEEDERKHALPEAAWRVVNAFEALGKTKDVASQFKSHQECESALVALKAMLSTPKSIVALAARLNDLKTKLEPGATMGVPSWVISEIADQEGQALDYIERSVNAIAGTISEWTWKGDRLVFTLKDRNEAKG